MAAAGGANQIPPGGVPRDWIARTRSDIADLADRYADQFNIPRQTVYNVIFRENGTGSGTGNEGLRITTSGAGATGVMQMTDGARRYYGITSNSSLEDNIRAGVNYLYDLGWNTGYGATGRIQGPRAAFDPAAAVGGYIGSPTGYYDFINGIDSRQARNFLATSQAYVLHTTQGVVPLESLPQMFRDLPAAQIFRQSAGFPTFDEAGWIAAQPGLTTHDPTFVPSELDLQPPAPIEGFGQPLPFLSERQPPTLEQWLNNPTGGANRDVDPYALQGTTIGEAFPGANFGFVPEARMAGAPEWDPAAGQWGTMNTGGVPEGGYGPWWNQGSLLPADWGARGGEVGNPAGTRENFDYATYLQGMNIPSSGQLTDWMGNPINVRGPEVITDTGLWQGNPDLPVGMGNRAVMGDIADMSTYGYTPFDYSAYFNALRANTVFNPGNLAGGFDMNTYNQAAGIGGGSGGAFDTTPAPTIDYQHYFNTTGINPPADPYTPNMGRTGGAWSPFSGYGAPQLGGPGGSFAEPIETAGGGGENMPVDEWGRVQQNTIATPPGGYGSTQQSPAEVWGNNYQAQVAAAAAAFQAAQVAAFNYQQNYQAVNAGGPIATIGGFGGTSPITIWTNPNVGGPNIINYGPGGGTSAGY